MKNYLNYYYNLSISNIRKRDNHYLFEINNVQYEMFPFFENLDQLLYLYRLIIFNNRYSHEIVFNNEKSAITLCKNIPYILIKKNSNSNKLIDLGEIINYDLLLNIDFSLNWKELWQKKMDYYEYQVKEIGNKYKIIRQSFPYYLGLSELAISLLNVVDLKEIYPYISHKRITYNEDYNTFLNPLNMLIDTRTRDIAEYLKTHFFNYDIVDAYLLDKIYKVNFNRSEVILLLSRLIYPTYYFDAYDKIIKGELDPNKLNFYIEKNVCFETFLKKIYNYYKRIYNIPIIEWFEN